MRLGVVNATAVELPHQNLGAGLVFGSRRYAPLPVTLEVPHARVDKVIAQRFS